VLRECRRVLKPGGRVASVVIEPAPQLDRRQLERAVEVGPGNMTADRALEDMTREVGFLPLVIEDWTSELELTLRRSLKELVAREPELRTGEGDDVFEHEVSKKADLLEGVSAGLLRRTLVVAAAP